MHPDDVIGAPVTYLLKVRRPFLLLPGYLSALHHSRSHGGRSASVYTYIRRPVDYRKCSGVDTAIGRYPSCSRRLVCGRGSCRKARRRAYRKSSLPEVELRGTTARDAAPRFFDLDAV